MKKLQVNELERLQGGGFWDGVCLAVGAVGVLGAVGITVVTAGTGTVVLGIGVVGCFVREIAK